MIKKKLSTKQLKFLKKIIEDFDYMVMELERSEIWYMLSMYEHKKLIEEKEYLDNKVLFNRIIKAFDTLSDAKSALGKVSDYAQAKLEG